LSFRARLTTGIDFLGSGRREPSRDVFEFQGILGRTALAGSLKRSDLLRPAATRTLNRIRLPKQTESTNAGMRTSGR
jgi:hypothetical protein